MDGPFLFVLCKYVCVRIIVQKPSHAIGVFPNMNTLETA